MWIFKRVVPHAVRRAVRVLAVVGLTMILGFVSAMMARGTADATHPLAGTAADWIWLVVLSWVCTIFTFYLYIRSLKKVSAFTMNLVLTLEPIYGIILAFAIFKENQSFSQWFYAGFALITVAVLFHMWRLLRPSTK